MTSLKKYKIQNHLVSSLFSRSSASLIDMIDDEVVLSSSLSCYPLILSSKRGTVRSALFFCSILVFLVLKEKIIIATTETKISPPMTADDIISFPQVLLSKTHPLFIVHS